jgi:hypothetical protein
MRLLPSAACAPSPVGPLHASSAGAVDARHGSDLFPDDLFMDASLGGHDLTSCISVVPPKPPALFPNALALVSARQRSKSKSHAQSARGKALAFHIYRPGPVSFEFQNSAPLFSTPAKLFQFSIQPSSI